jgi:hypothetical protein
VKCDTNMTHGIYNVKVCESVYMNDLPECTVLGTASNNECSSVLTVSRFQKILTLTLTSWCILTD